MNTQTFRNVAWFAVGTLVLLAATYQLYWVAVEILASGSITVADPRPRGLRTREPLTYRFAWQDAWVYPLALLMYAVGGICIAGQGFPSMKSRLGLGAFLIVLGFVLSAGTLLFSSWAGIVQYFVVVVAGIAVIGGIGLAQSWLDRRKRSKDNTQTSKSASDPGQTRLR